MLKLLFIFLGGGLGSMCRYSISAYIVKTTSTHFPYATFLANAIGCLLIGLLIGFFQRSQNHLLYLLLVTGFCGGFTTFSTFSNESFHLLRQGFYIHALAYIALSLLTGLTAVAAGICVVKHLS